VDVNVHPTKAEVRFLDQGLVHEVLRRAIVDALGQGGTPELILAQEAIAQALPRDAALPLPAPSFGTPPASTWSSGLGRAEFAVAPTDVSPASALWPDQRVSTAPGRDTAATLLRPLAPLGQFRNTFIIAIDDEGIAIIDQHVAHERILFEQIAERLTTGKIESQRLLTPVVLDVGPGEHATLLTHAPALAKFGFDVEDFGGSSLRVSAVPALLAWSRSEAALRAVASDLDGLAPGASVDEALRRMAATMACHAAVKANDPLTREKMQYLLDELRRTAHSSVCPHGRPVVLRLTRREIEKNFDRI
jgi:DNA mismatch repair protein MutL